MQRCDPARLEEFADDAVGFAQVAFEQEDFAACVGERVGEGAACDACADDYYFGLDIV